MKVFHHKYLNSTEKVVKIKESDFLASFMTAESLLRDQMDIYSYMTKLAVVGMLASCKVALVQIL